jgi:hypothetical protein
MIRAAIRKAPSGGTYEDWRELYDTGKLNTLEFGGGTNWQSGNIIATGFFRSTTEARFYLPINLPNTPSSISIAGTFAVLNENFGTVASGLDASSITLITARSNRMASISIAGLSGLTSGSFYYLRADTSSSKITVNP